MEKRFFFVCAGLFLLVAAYALGARSAVAQSGGLFVASGSFDPDTDPCGVDGSGQLWMLDKASHQSFGPYPMPVPGGQIVEVTADMVGGGNYVGGVLYTNGDAYFHDMTTGWAYLGNIFAGGPIPTRRESFGAVKARYR